MAITLKTKKKLWAKSGNLCAICKNCLVTEEGKDIEAIVGEECHIIASSDLGPRGDSSFTGVDDYDNLILLCRNCHKKVDDNTKYFSIDRLKRIKYSHESWIKGRLKEKRHMPKVLLLSEKKHGNELLNELGGSYAFMFSNDNLKDEHELEIISGFIQNVTDWCDAWNDIEQSDSIKACYYINEDIKQINDNGFKVFATTQKSIATVNKQDINMTVAIMVVARADNPAITTDNRLAYLWKYRVAS